MSSFPGETASNWSWPDYMDSSFSSEAPHVPGSFSQDELGSTDSETKQSSNGEHENTGPQAQRHYPSRTCRICLEVVEPSFNLGADGLASLFNPNPTVTYISSNSTSGRLISPCKCTGTSRYVHEGCLQAWRHADPAYGRRNYWECPTCKFRYRLERMRWARWISSPILLLLMTVCILFMTIFVFGFVADPIINLYLDPYETLVSIPSDGPEAIYLDNAPSWTEHLLKGVASLGLLGFAKVFFAMSPLWNLRQIGIIGGGSRRGGTGRQRLENISWGLVLIGIITFLYAIRKWIRRWSKRILETAGERVADVQSEGDDLEDEVTTD